MNQDLVSLENLQHLQLASYTHFWQFRSDGRYKSFVSRETMLIEAELGFNETEFLTALMLKFRGLGGFVYANHGTGDFGFISGDNLTTAIESELIRAGVFILIAVCNASNN